VDRADLHARILRRLDLQDGGYVTDGELQELCIEGYLELYDLMYSALDDEAPVAVANLTVSSSTGLASVGAGDGVFRLVRLDRLTTPGNQYIPLSRGTIVADPLQSQKQVWSTLLDVRYYPRRLPRTGPGASFAWTISFDPIPTEDQTVRIWYLPAPPITFQVDGETVDQYPDEYPEYIVAYVAGQLARRQEIDPRVFDFERERIRGMIERYSRPHHIGEARYVADLRQHQIPYRRNPYLYRRGP